MLRSHIMILVLDKLTSRLEKVQNLFSLFISLCNHVDGLQSISTSLALRRTAIVVVINMGNPCQSLPNMF